MIFAVFFDLPLCHFKHPLHNIWHSKAVYIQGMVENAKLFWHDPVAHFMFCFTFQNISQEQLMSI